MTICFLIIFGLYFLLLLILIIGWEKSTRSEGVLSVNRKFISVVVAMRNEESSIENLLHSLSNQSYPADNFEVIVVDDHSEDDSESIAKKWCDRISSLQVVSLDGNKNGKKISISWGISLAKGEVIATTDADSLAPFDWLERINKSFQDEKRNMCIGLVSLQNHNSFFSKLQSIEFASVIGMSASLAALGKPVMCNGANLSFRKKSFEEVGGYSGNEHIASGDDEFLMRKIASKYSNSINVLKDCVVITKPQATLQDFLNQRLRWASKWKHNSSLFARTLALFIFLVQLSWLTLVVWSAVNWSVITLSLVVIKLTMDFIFLLNSCRFLKMKFSILAFACLQFVYPFYVLYVGIFSQYVSHQWKGRRI